MRTQSLPLAIVGGGIGGLCTALSLAQRGRPVHVLERAPEFGEIGAGIQIAPNASRVFAELGVLEAMHACAVLPASIVWMDMISGKRVTYLDLGKPFLERYTYPYIVMHRSDLLDVLLNACIAHPSVTLETGRDVRTIVDRDAYMEVTCTDGSVYHADALIAADGIWSKARLLLDPIVRPQYDGFIAYRGAIPMARVSEQAGLDSVLLWSGPNRHFMQYPVRRGELYNQVAVFKSPSTSPNIDDWGSEAELDAAYADVCPQLQSGLQLIQRDRHWVMADRPTLDRWTVNRMTLLGDSAHPMYQYAAQGACQAIEDASVLAACIAAHDDIRNAFAAYEAERIPRTAQVQKTARWFGDTMHLSGAGGVFRNQFLERRAPDDYSQFDFLYGYGTNVGRAGRTIDAILA